MFAFKSLSLQKCKLLEDWSLLLYFVGKVNVTLFGLDPLEAIDTFYFMLRALDVKNNIADWSNVVLASYIEPEPFIEHVSYISCNKSRLVSQSKGLYGNNIL